VVLVQVEIVVLVDLDQEGIVVLVVLVRVGIVVLVVLVDLVQVGIGLEEVLEMGFDQIQEDILGIGLEVVLATRDQDLIV